MKKKVMNIRPQEFTDGGERSVRYKGSDGKFHNVAPSESGANPNENGFVLDFNGETPEVRKLENGIPTDSTVLELVNALKKDLSMPVAVLFKGISQYTMARACSYVGNTNNGLYIGEITLSAFDTCGPRIYQIYFDDTYMEEGISIGLSYIQLPELIYI